MSLPNDPVILLSYINTLLRDEYQSFEELCKSLCTSADDISSKLEKIGYVYDPNTNSFRQYPVLADSFDLTRILSRLLAEWEGL